jgi:hypothetical protein
MSIRIDIMIRFIICVLHEILIKGRSYSIHKGESLLAGKLEEKGPLQRAGC